VSEGDGSIDDEGGRTETIGKGVLGSPRPSAGYKLGDGPLETSGSGEGSGGIGEDDASIVNTTSVVAPASVAWTEAGELAFDFPLREEPRDNLDIRLPDDDFGVESESDEDPNENLDRRERMLLGKVCKLPFELCADGRLNSGGPAINDLSSSDIDCLPGEIFSDGRGCKES
jgi:hypothetical protein